MITVACKHVENDVVHIFLCIATGALKARGGVSILLVRTNPTNTLQSSPPFFTSLNYKSIHCQLPQFQTCQLSFPRTCSCAHFALCLQDPMSNWATPSHFLVPYELHVESAAHGPPETPRNLQPQSQNTRDGVAGVLNGTFVLFDSGSP